MLVLLLPGCLPCRAGLPKLVANYPWKVAWRRNWTESRDPRPLKLTSGQMRGRVGLQNLLPWKLPWQPIPWVHQVTRFFCNCNCSAGPKRGCLNKGAWNPQESGRKAPLSCNAAFSMLQCSSSFAAAQLLVKMASALQKSECRSATSAAQHSENCGATSVLACGTLQGWGLEVWV